MADIEREWPLPCIDHGIVDCAECAPWLDQQASDRAERDELHRRWRRCCELGDALARAAEDFLTADFPTDLSGGNRAYYKSRRTLAKAIQLYEEG